MSSRGGKTGRSKRQIPVPFANNGGRAVSVGRGKSGSEDPEKGDARCAAEPYCVELVLFRGESMMSVFPTSKRHGMESASSRWFRDARQVGMVVYAQHCTNEGAGRQPVSASASGRAGEEEKILQPASRHDARENPPRRDTSATDVLLAGPLRSVPLLARDRAVPGIFGVGALVRDRARLLRPLGFERARFAVSDLDGFDARSRLFDRDGSSTDILAYVCARVRATSQPNKTKKSRAGERESGLTVHLFPRLEKVFRVAIGDEPVPFALVGVLVSDHLGLDKGREPGSGECGSERVVRDGGVEVTDKEAKVRCSKPSTSVVCLTT